MSAVLQRILVDAGEAAEICGLSLRAFHEQRKTSAFPKPVSLGPRCLRWRVRDLEAWACALPEHAEATEPAHLRLARGARLSRRSGKDAS